MTKLLTLRDRILVGLAIVGDLFDNIRLLGGLTGNLAEGYYGYIPGRYKYKSYCSTVSQMLTTGNIERKTDKQGKTFLILSSTGKNYLHRKFPLLTFQTRKWDGKFMMVVFDISEESKVIRNRLRVKLMELGFGMLQKSVWISPYHYENDMYEYIITNKLQDSVFVLTAQSIYIKDQKNFIKKMWRLEDINNEYLRLIVQCKKRLKDNNTFNTGQLLEKYLDIVNRDPQLPAELLPENWYAAEAKVYISKLLVQN